MKKVSLRKAGKPFRVLILVSLQSVAGRKKFSGVNRFLGQGYDWDFELLRSEVDFTPERLAVERTRGYDGFLILAPLTRTALAAFDGCPTPLVLTTDLAPDVMDNLPNSVIVRDDNRSILRVAIDHLLAIPRLAAVGYIPTPVLLPWSNERRNAFEAAAARMDIPARVFTGRGDDPEALTTWLKELPKPAGVIAAFDDRGREVLEAARKGGIRVPGDLSVLGIGNDEPICDMARPPLSSVVIDFPEEGYRAARELQAMMLRRILPPKKIISIGASDLIVRSSTNSPANNAALVRRALTFINQRACDGIGVDEVVSFLRVSRRLAYLRFREHVGTSIHAMILARRLDRAKQLLQMTRRSITEIAVLCGYRDGNYFKNVFRRETGMAPSVWRKAHCGTGETPGR